MIIIATMLAATLHVAAAVPQRVPVNVVLVETLKVSNAAAMIVRIPDGRDIILLPKGATSEHLAEAAKQYQALYRQNRTVAHRQEFSVVKRATKTRPESERSFVRQLASAPRQQIAGEGELPTMTIWVLVSS